MCVYGIHKCLINLSRTNALLTSSPFSRAAKSALLAYNISLPVSLSLLCFLPFASSVHTKYVGHRTPFIFSPSNPPSLSFFFFDPPLVPLLLSSHAYFPFTPYFISFPHFTSFSFILISLSSISPLYTFYNSLLLLSSPLLSSITCHRNLADKHTLRGGKQ